MLKPVEDVFDTVAGSRMPENLPGSVEGALGICREHLKYLIDGALSSYPEGIAGIYANMVDSLELNALAYADDHHEIIGLNAGAALILPHISNWILAHRNVFPDIGNPTDERIPEPFDLSVLSMSGKVRSIDSIAVSWLSVGPKDQARSKYAVYIALQAWNFLVAHELGHIVRCHIPYLLKKHNFASLSLLEFGCPGVSEQKRSVRRVLEADADGFAGRVVAGSPIRDGLDGAKFCALGEYAENFDWGWPEVYRSWIRAIGLLFQIMSVTDHRLSFDSSERTHPYPDVRMLIVFNEAINRWLDVIPDIDILKRITLEAVHELHAMFFDNILPPTGNKLNQIYGHEFGHFVQAFFAEMKSIGLELNDLSIARISKIEERIANGELTIG